MSSKFEIWYKKWLSQLDEEVDISVWENIQDELDLQDVWQNISSELDNGVLYNSASSHSHLNLIIGFIAGVFLMIAPVKYLNPSLDQNNFHSFNTNDISLVTTDNHDQEVKKDIQKVPEKEILKVSEKAVSGAKKQQELLNAAIPKTEPYTKANPIQYAEQGLNLMKLKNIEPIWNNSFSNNLNRPIIPVKLFVDSSFTDRKRLNISLMDIGFIFGYKNTWLLNYETYNGLDPGKIDNALPTYRKDFGITTTMALNYRPVLGMEFFWRSGVGQRYQQYINASYMERDIDLVYLKFQAYYIWDHYKVPGQVLAGAYYARLKAGEETQGETKLNISDYYSDYDYGLLLGYQLNIHLQNRITIKPGMRLNYNFKNIFIGDDNIPSHLKNTKSLAAGFNISVAYRVF